MKTKPSINDLQQFDRESAAGRHQLWMYLVETWGVDRDLADWFIQTQANEIVARQKAEDQLAISEAKLEALEGQ
jgi:hypothetical protein